MKKEEISEIISELDDTFVDESLSVIRKKSRVRYTALAACAALVIASSLGFAYFSGDLLTHENPSSAAGEIVSDNVEKNQQEIATDSAVMPEIEMAISPLWRDMSTSQKFSEFSMGNMRYSSQNTLIEETNIDKAVGSALFSGYDIYEDKTYKTDGSVYTIKNISDKCALAVRFSGEEAYYVYINSEYSPETLGQLIEDIDMNNTVSFGKAYQDVTDEKTYTNIIYADFDDCVIWEMLLSDTDIKNIQFDRFHEIIASVSVDIPLLGYKNISLGVTKDGYLITNILNTQKCFFIGKEKAEAFSDYLKNNVPFKENSTVFENPDGTIPGKGDSVPGYNPDTPELISPPYDPSTGLPPPDSNSSSSSPVMYDFVEEETTKI